MPEIGWIGLGVMGSSMCGHLLARGHRVTVHTRTAAKARPLLDRGAIWAENPRDVAGRCDVVFTMLGFPDDVRQVYWGDGPGAGEAPGVTPARDGLLPAARTGQVFVDMTTAPPALAVEIASAAAARGAAALDAPVSGGDVGARNATLTIMVGGDAAALDSVHPLLALIGKTIVHQGAPGAGQHAKMCNQIVIAGTMIGVCEALLYAARAGLEPDALLQAIRPGAAGCWTLDNLAPRILQGNFDPGFYVDHFVKDMGIALDEARRMGLSLPGLSLVHDLYRAAQAQGHGRRGTHALYLALQSLSVRPEGDAHVK